MAKLADAIALGAIGATLGGSNPLPPTKLLWFNIYLQSEVVTLKKCGSGHPQPIDLARGFRHSDFEKMREWLSW